MRSNLSSIVLAASALAFTPHAVAQAPTQSAIDNSIVVTAQRSGAPIWTINTERGTIILVGELRAVPKSTPWEPFRLEEATKEAQRVILRSNPKFSPGDAFRMMFRGGKFFKLPNKTVAGDYLDADQRARLAVLEDKYDINYDRRSFLMSAFDLLARRLDFDDETTDDATDIVRKAAKKADVPIERLERFRGEDLLDNLAAASPESHIPCLEAAMTATEAGQGIIAERGDDWRRYKVAAVMENPLEEALGKCWPWADNELGEEIRGLWTDAIEDAADARGVTLAVVPLRVLAEDQGVLDQLEARGYLIGGPDWRPKTPGDAPPIMQEIVQP